MSQQKNIGIISNTSGKVNFEWKINDFFSYTEEDAFYFSSKCLGLNSVWIIEIRPNGQRTDNSTGYLSLFLHEIKSKTPKTIDFTMSIKTAKNLVENQLKVLSKCVGDGAGLGWPKFIERSTLLQEKENLVPSGNLTIICTICLKDYKQAKDEKHRKLVEDVKNLFLSEECTDVKLLVQEETYSAHRSILAARSPVFAAMFRNETLEKKTGIVKISDINAEAFHVFLLFLYSGEVEYSECNVCNLYKISDKYDVPDLKLLCTDYMIRNLSVENFCEIFILSHQFKENKLLTQVQLFFNTNFEKVVSSDDWETFLEENSRLANSLLKGMAPKVKITE